MDMDMDRQILILILISLGDSKVEMESKPTNGRRD